MLIVIDRPSSKSKIDRFIVNPAMNFFVEDGYLQEQQSECS
ncbi:MAG: hypothetical protein VKJ24_21945 [Synechococcales bacterium]|nr:hypothetical protein [Synechococcales bacterium]